jgi:ATPase subunit of ABC transporter with duplicated ATPase domains
MIAVKDVTVRFGGRAVVNDVSLTLSAGQKTGLVGPNGVGKSTLLKVMSGSINPAHGTVLLSDHETVAYVPQDYALIGSEPVGEYLKRRAGLLELELLMASFERLSPTDEESIQQYVDAMERYQSLGGYEYSGNLAKVLAQLGLTPSVLDRRIEELSGGQQVKIGLASILVSRFSVLLLDEPTNNLDLHGLDLLEEYVATSPAAMLIVSHDRRFLDLTVTAIAEIDEHTRELAYYGVGYAEFRQARANLLAAHSRRYRDYLDEVSRLQTAVVRAGGLVSKNGGSRSDNDKLGANYRSERGNTSAAGAKKRAERALKRLDAVEEPVESWELRLELPQATRSGDQVVSLSECVVTYPGFVLGPVSLTIGRQDRVAVVGSNGAGKTTLIKLITACLAPESGQVRLGERVQIGRMDQDQRLTLGHDTVLEAFVRESGVTDEGEARTLLAKFNLPTDKVLRPAAKLSPGERARLMLAVLMAKGANLLVLDEPTNHLDLDAQEQLEAALLAYDGTVVVVSHDREFLERIGVSTVFTVEEGAVTEREYLQ